MNAPKPALLAFLGFCFRYLMGSSEYTEDDVRRPSLRLVRELIYRCCALFLPLASLVGLPPVWHQQVMAVNLLEVGGMLLTLVNAWVVLVQNRKLIPLLGLIGIGGTIFLAKVLSGYTVVVYFSSAFCIAFYLLPSRRLIVWSNLAWWCVSSGAAFASIPVADAVSISANYLVIWLLAELLFSVSFYGEMELKDLAVRDPLTDVFNRRVLEDTMLNAIAMQEKYGLPASIILIDIDHFKQVNDTYGHDEGDSVLRNAASFLQDCLRVTDTICRYGGEEFVVALMNTPLDKAVRVAENIRDGISNCTLSDKQKITVSCGVAEVASHDTIKKWFRRSDEALYRAKQLGRDRVEAHQQRDG